MKAPGLLGATVIGASVVLAAAVFALVGAVLRDAGGSATEAALARLGDAIATRDGRIADLEAERDALARERDSLRDQLAAASAAAARAPVPASPSAALPTDQFGGTAPPETEDIVDPMELAKGRFNREVIRPTPEVLREVLGEPRQSYSQDCQPVTNPKLVALIETRQIGTFKLSMIRPALDSLQQVVQRLKTEEPDLYAALGTAGALCARYVRGSGRSVSSHAWGAAVEAGPQRAGLEGLGEPPGLGGDRGGIGARRSGGGRGEAEQRAGEGRQRVAPGRGGGGRPDDGARRVAGHMRPSATH